MQIADLLHKPNQPRIHLKPLDISVIEPYLEMLADRDVARLTGSTATFTREQIEQWLLTRSTTPNRKDFGIFDQDRTFVGEVVLNEFNDEKNSMNIRIALRGKPWFNRGIGSQALALALEYAFDTLVVDKVTLDVLVENPRAIKAYEKVGFRTGRQFTSKNLRYQRMSITKLDFVYALGVLGIERHLPKSDWFFEFDNGKRRAGLCNYTDHRISISRYLADIHTVDESLQVLAHEIGHALCAPSEGHSKKWLATAKSLGYRAQKFSGNEIAREVAPWVGHCPRGHEHYRYRRPTRQLSCAICSKEFSPAHLIRWRKSEPD